MCVCAYIYIYNVFYLYSYIYIRIYKQKRGMPEVVVLPWTVPQLPRHLHDKQRYTTNMRARSFAPAIAMKTATTE